MMKQWFANPDPASNILLPWFRRLQTQRLEFYEIKLKQIFNFNTFKNLHKKKQAFVSWTNGDDFHSVFYLEILLQKSKRKQILYCEDGSFVKKKEENVLLDTHNIGKFLFKYTFKF